jgi:hypothetical protein
MTQVHTHETWERTEFSWAQVMEITGREFCDVALFDPTNIPVERVDGTWENIVQSEDGILWVAHYRPAGRFLSPYEIIKRDEDSV